MEEEIEVDRSAFVGVHERQNLDALNAAVARGEWTLKEAALAHIAFMRSDMLQMLITRDVQAAEAMLKGQVH